MVRVVLGMRRGIREAEETQAEDAAAHNPDGSLLSAECDAEVPAGPRS